MKKFFLVPMIVTVIVLAFSLPAFAVSVEDDIRWQDELLDTITDIEGDVVGGFDLSLTAAGEVSNNLTVSVTVQDSNGDTLAADTIINYWLTDLTPGNVNYTNMLAGLGGAETTSLPDGDLTIDARTGYRIREITTDVSGILGTGSDGIANIVIEDDDTDADWYVCVEANGNIGTSLSINHSA